MPYDRDISADIWGTGVTLASGFAEEKPGLDHPPVTPNGRA
jgi:hypothetical protein